MDLYKKLLLCFLVLFGSVQAAQENKENRIVLLCRYHSQESGFLPFFCGNHMSPHGTNIVLKDMRIDPFGGILIFEGKRDKPLYVGEVVREELSEYKTIIDKAENLMKAGSGSLDFVHENDFDELENIIVNGPVYVDRKKFDEIMKNYKNNAQEDQPFLVIPSGKKYERILVDGSKVIKTEGEKGRVIAYKELNYDYITKKLGYKVDDYPKDNNNNEESGKSNNSDKKEGKSGNKIWYIIAFVAVIGTAIYFLLDSPKKTKVRPRNRHRAQRNRQKRGETIERKK